MRANRRHASLLQSSTTGLLVIDLQQPLLDVMWNQQELIANVRRLAEAARVLELPVLVTEQNPQRLGPTAACLADTMPEGPPVPKMAFSCCREQRVMDSLRALRRATWLLCGVEAHVCVCQTALDLLDQEYQVQIVADAVGSRTQANREAGLGRARQAGAVITTTEMALFELLERAGTEQFRAVHRLVR
jgi:nicotinamidase-related amidase